MTRVFEFCFKVSTLTAILFEPDEWSRESLGGKNFFIFGCISYCLFRSFGSFLLLLLLLLKFKCFLQSYSRFFDKHCRQWTQTPSRHNLFQSFVQLQHNIFSLSVISSLFMPLRCWQPRLKELCFRVVHPFHSSDHNKEKHEDNFIKLNTNVHFDSRMKWFEFSGQMSFWPHKSVFGHNWRGHTLISHIKFDTFVL